MLNTACNTECKADIKTTLGVTLDRSIIGNVGVSAAVSMRLITQRMAITNTDI